jgi:hypothetical protein
MGANALEGFARHLPVSRESVVQVGDDVEHVRDRSCQGAGHEGVDPEARNREEVHRSHRDRGADVQQNPERQWDLHPARRKPHRPDVAQVVQAGERLAIERDLALGFGVAAVKDFGDAIEDGPDLLEHSVLVAGHGRPLPFQHRADVGLELSSELAARRLGEAAHGPEQIQHFVRLALDRGASVVELLPDHDDHEGEEHGVDRAERLEVVPRNVVALDELFAGDEAPHEVESENGEGDAGPDGGSERPDGAGHAAGIAH